MLFKTKLLAGCVASLLASSVALADSSVEFKGYARAGFSLNLSQLKRAGDSQGEKELSTRHVRDLNYIQLWVTKNLDNGSKFVLSLDNEAFQNVYKNDDWSKSGFRVREAYYQTEITPELAIWAGQRQFLFDDIRVLDILNNYNAFGAGVVIAKDTNIFVSVSKNDSVVEIEAVNPLDLITIAQKINDKTDLNEQEQAKYAQANLEKRDLQFVAHSKINLGTLTLAPEVSILRSGDVINPEAEDVKVKSSQTGFKGRLLVGYSDDNIWNNASIAYEQTPRIKCKGGQCEPADKLKTITFTESGSIEFGSFGILAGAIVKYEKYSNKKQFRDKKGEVDSSKSRIIASVDVQPVAYITNNFHLALDINKTFRKKYTAEEKSAALLITPIARYALAKNTIGQAQVYTSVTYGKYDVKESVFNGKKNTDSLVTMQTGFELAF